MTKFKKISKSIFIILFSCFLAILPAFIFKDISFYLDVNAKKDNLSLLTIWHCETHEGGKQSRLSYLKILATEFEKEYKGIMVYVRLLSPDEVESLLLKGEKPDLLSFGSGVDVSVANSLLGLNHEYGVRDDFLSSGKVNKHLLALPYMVSGYVYVLRESQTNPQEYISQNVDKILTANTGRVYYDKQNFNLKNTYTSYQAYVEYKKGDAPILLGTMRDVARLTTNGQGNYQYIPAEYTNLAQYIGKCKDSEMADNFIAKLFSPSAQSKLVDMGLFSPNYRTKQYYSSPYSQIEDVIAKLELARLW
ncbi:MAG: hypothetical protein ACLRFG_00120 [Clostridia bacterium]